VKSPAELSPILRRDKNDHTSRQCRRPCFPEQADLSCAFVAARAQRAARANRNSIACQTKCPGRLLQRGWAPQERRSLAWATRWQGSIRHDDRRSRARWNVDGDHKSSIWFSTTDGARELVCAYVALSGNHCELRKRRLWKLLARAHAVIEGNGRVFILVQLRAADQQLSSSGSRRRQSRPKSFAYAGC